MCRIDLKATICFISVFPNTTNAIITMPTKEIDAKIVIISALEVNILNRIKPIPPSFNKIPAKIIDPNTGAST